MIFSCSFMPHSARNFPRNFDFLKKFQCDLTFGFVHFALFFTMDSCISQFAATVHFPKSSCGHCAEKAWKTSRKSMKKVWRNHFVFCTLFRTNFSSILTSFLVTSEARIDEKSLPGGHRKKCWFLCLIFLPFWWILAALGRLWALPAPPRLLQIWHFFSKTCRELAENLPKTHPKLPRDPPRATKVDLRARKWRFLTFFW